MHASRVEMGSMETVKQKVRSDGWESAAESLGQDIRYGVRQLLRSPGFSLVALLTLALGIGANTAVFTLVHAVMLKQLQVANPHQLYRVGEGEFFCCEWGGLQDSWGTFDYPFYKHLRETDPSFEQIAAFSGYTPTFNVRRAGSQSAAQTANGEYVSGNYFSTLGIQSSAGRLLNPADDRPEAPATAVMGYRTWQQRYASDPSILGSTLLVNGLPVTLVGIAPAGFVSNPAAHPPRCKRSSLRNCSNGFVRNIAIKAKTRTRSASNTFGSHPAAQASRPSATTRKTISISSRPPRFSSCSLPAPTWPTCCSRAAHPASNRPPCAWLLEPDAPASSAQC
jgi:hypothetical protein